MSAAKTAHANSSVRARSAAATERKTVYRAVVADPLALDYAPLPHAARHAALEALLSALESAGAGESIAEWRHAHLTANRKAKSAERAHIKRNRSNSAAEVAQGAGKSEAAPAQTGEATPSRPPLVQELVVGINEVTRALESRIRWGRWHLGDPAAAPPSSQPAAPEAADRATAPASKKRPRTRKRTDQEAMPLSRPTSAAPPLADHPAYAFLREGPPPASTSAAPVHLPPYLVEPGSADGPESGNEGRAWRLLVNSQATRLRNPPRSAGRRPKQPETGSLLPAHPAAPLGDSAQPTDPPATSTSTGAKAPTVPLVDLVFVCKPDINPPSLVAHLPSMVAAANGVNAALESVRASAKIEQDMQVDGAVKETDSATPGAPATAAMPEMRPVLLVPLDAGAERRLADALGLRRVAALAVSSLLPEMEPVRALLLEQLHLTPLSAPWLVPHLLHPPAHPRAAPRFAPTTIKHLKTSAPLNPRAEVVRRKEEKVAKREGAKEHRRQKRRKANAAEHSAGGEDDVYVAED
ncbi:hypothetical protein JCM8202_003887 [Rhodotorula sphaerocarpa]